MSEQNTSDVRGLLQILFEILANLNEFNRKLTENRKLNVQVKYL